MILRVAISFARRIKAVKEHESSLALGTKRRNCIGHLMETGGQNSIKRASNFSGNY